MRIRLRALLTTVMLASALAAGCSAPIPSTDLPPTREVAPALEFPELRDYRGVVDLRFKSTGLDQAAIADMARVAQIDFVFLGDRVSADSADYGVAGFSSNVLFIPGAAFDAAGGEIVALNLHAPIERAASESPADLIGAIHEQGGLALAANLAHFNSPDAYALADALEVYNQRSVWQSVNPTSIWLRAIFVGTDRFLRGLDVWPDENLAVYDRMASRARVTMVAGIGAADDLPVMGSRVGTFPQLFLFYTSHLLAPERAAEPLLEALKRGHSYVSFDLLGYADSFAFYAESASAKTLMGDETAMVPGLKLRAETPGPADRIVLMRNGAEVSSADNTNTLEFTPSSPGAYRVEAMRRGHPWILSNPVYLR
jgi:hypothetical protein